MSRDNSTLAFSMVELLAVIAIIGALLGMLLPAVQKAREAANLAQCQSNLRQIGIAFWSYHDVHQMTPPNGAFVSPAAGWMGSVTPFATAGGYPLVGLPGVPTWSASVFWYLLPYMEGEDERSIAEQARTMAPRVAFDAFDNVVPNPEPVIAPGAAKTFLCPSRRSQNPQSLGRTDYGLSDRSNSISSPLTRIIDPSTGVSHGVRGRMAIEGLDDFGTSCSLSRVPDGGSNTLLLAHKGMDPEFYNAPYCEIPGWVSTWFDVNTSGARDLPYIAQDTNSFSVPLFNPPWRNENFGLRWNIFLTRWSTERYGFAFFKDRKGGYYVEQLYNDYNYYLGKAPCYQFMTSPHASMPTLWADGSVRTMAFTKDPAARTISYQFRPSKEAYLLWQLWMSDDGTSNGPIE